MELIIYFVPTFALKPVTPYHHHWPLSFLFSGRKKKAFYTIRYVVVGVCFCSIFSVEMSETRSGSHGVIKTRKIRVCSKQNNQTLKNHSFESTTTYSILQPTSTSKLRSSSQYTQFQMVKNAHNH